MSKNIWIDGLEANVPQRVGSGQVAFELLKNIWELDHKNNYTILLPNNPMPDLPKERQGWKYKILRPGKLWTRIAIPLYYKFAKIKPDLIFSPTHYIPRFISEAFLRINVKRVPIIFDLSFIHFPSMFKPDDLYKLTNWTKYSVLNASEIITISESSKKDIVDIYKIPKSKITVAYPGYDETVFKPVRDEALIEKVQRKYQISGVYIIYIGTVQPRKNLLRLIKVMKKIENVKLVVVGKIKGKGKQGWMNEQILSEPKDLGIEDRIVFTDFVPTEELPALIAGSKAFILPSLWEGFGIPVVEAMATGTPVITSNVSSLPEVTGEGGLLINPESDNQIEQAIRLLVTDKKLHAKLSKKALEQAQKFSWQKMAKEVIKVLETA